jgi:hypothetical protein
VAHVQVGYTPGTTEVHRPYVGLGVPVLQIPCPAGPQCFERGACPASDVGPEAFFGLAFVAKLEGAQFATDKPQAVDVAITDIPPDGKCDISTLARQAGFSELETIMNIRLLGDA